MGKLERKDCDYAFAQTQKCVNVDPAYGDNGWNLYPADYGSQCQEWPEPAQTACFAYNTTAGDTEPTALLAPTEDWCQKKWCYIDPCKCDAPDKAASSVFAFLGEMFYSYAACGSTDLFTAEYAADNIGSGTCEVATSGVEAAVPVSVFLLSLPLLHM